jgi:hypothetical protein
VGGLSESKLEVVVKAIDLMQHTLQVTSNKKRYPAKHVTLINRIQNTCMDIYENLLDANRLILGTSKAERLGLQTKAISSCDKLSCYIEISMNLGLIGSRSVEFWQKKVNDVKYMAIAWREKDKDR